MERGGEEVGLYHKRNKKDVTSLCETESEEREEEGEDYWVVPNSPHKRLPLTEDNSK